MEQQRQQLEASVAEERRRAEEQRLTEARIAERKRLDELNLAEERRKADQRLEDERRMAEEKRADAMRAAEAKLAAERVAAADKLHRATCVPKITPAGMGARLVNNPVKKLTLNSGSSEFEEAVSHAIAADRLRKNFTEKIAELVRESGNTIKSEETQTFQGRPNTLLRGLTERAKRSAVVFAELGERTYRNCLFDAFDLLEIEKIRLERWLS